VIGQLWENNALYHFTIRVSLLPANLLQPVLPASAKDQLRAGQLYGSAQGLLLAKAAQQHNGP
jgi:transcription-repair coupling factor (superfamily II helicase)